MADLKLGTTLGGAGIWSASNLPLLPAGGQLTYKGWRVYTENDKPTKAEIGLGNVTNDAQVKKAGDDMTGSLNITGQNSQLTVPYRLLMQRAVAGDPYVLFVRPDNNPVSNGYPSGTIRVMTITARTATTADPVSGAQLVNVLGDQTAQGNGALTLQAFAAPNTTTGASGQRTAEIFLNGNGQLSMTGSGLTIGMQTIVNGTMFAQQMAIKGDGNKNLFFQDAGGNELGLVYADTGKNVYVRTGGGAYVSRFASDGTLILANHLTVPGISTFTGQAAFNGRLSVGADYDTQGANSAIIRVDTSGDGNAVGDGVTHFGYKDSNGRFNHYFRGTGVTYINTKLGLNVNVPSFYNDVPQGTPAQYFLPTVGQGAKNYLRQFRGGNADTIWHETVQGGLWRLATGSTDVQEELQVSTAGYCRTRQEFQSTATKGDGGQFRAVQGNYGFFIRNDGNNTYFMLTASGDPYGTWGSLRPFTISNGNGVVSMGHGLNLGGSGLNVSAGGVDVTSGGARIAGNSTFYNTLTAGALVTTSYINTAGDISVTVNARRHIRFSNGSNVDGYIYKDPNGAWQFNNGTNAGSWNMQTDQVFYGSGNANFNDVYIRSDIRLKTNLVELKGALDIVSNLVGYHYDKKLNADEKEYTEHEVGLIAQDVQKVLPEAVKEHSDSGMLTISPSAINALLVNAINEIRERLEVIENKLGA